jgi:hypothetical protein
VKRRIIDMTNAAIDTLLPPATDTSAIRLGGAFRLPPVAKAESDVNDTGRIRLGGAFRLAA